MVKCCAYIIVYFLGIVTAFSQSAGSKIYTLLADNSQSIIQINTLCQLSSGYIMVGASNGLYRFDGINFFKVNKAAGVADDVTAICEISTKETLIGYKDGSIAILRQNNKIEAFNLQEGFPKVAINKIIVDKSGTIWFATAGEGIYFYKQKILYQISQEDGLTDNYIYDISLLPGNNVLVSTDHGINFCSADLRHKFIKSFTSKDGLPDNIVKSICPVNNNNFWIGMQDGGVTMYNNFSDSLGKPGNWLYGEVNDMLAVGSKAYVGTDENGIIQIRYDDVNNAIYVEKQTLQIKKVSCLLRDKEGNIWAGGNNQLLRMVGNELQFLFSFSTIAPEDLHMLFYDQNGTLWFNKRNKLFNAILQPDGSWQQQESVIPLISQQSDITSMYQDKYGMIWVGTMGSGIILLDPNTGETRVLKEYPTLINSSILSISGKENTVWIASLEGAIECRIKENTTDIPRGETYSFTNFAEDKNLGSKYVYDIFTDSHNRVWFATDGKGTIVLENNVFKPVKGLLESDVIYKIVEDKQGNLWFNTFNKGLVRYDGKHFTVFSIQQGLTDLNITSLIISGDYLLAAHKKCIDIINTRTGTISYLNEEQGLSNINSDFNTFTRGRVQDIYFSNEFSVYKYQPGYQLQQKPSILIDKVQLFLTDTLVQNGHVFSSDANNISFYFTGLFYEQPEKIQYQYKLEGYDKDWVSTKDHMKNFPRLTSGTYTFKIRVSLNQNFSNAPEASFVFTIEEPYWQQLWFILLVLVLVISILFVIIKQREWSIEKLNNLERQKIQSQLETLRNQINPHFLFNSFNTLISEIEEDSERAVAYVEHLSDFYRSIVLQKDKDLISLEEEITILKNYLFIQQKRFGQALLISILLTEAQQKTYYIVPLALQLLFENAVKHNVVSLEHPLHIELFINEEQQLVIRNNIREKFTPEKGSHTGLLNIQRRYQLLSGKSVTIENDTLYFTVKIPLLDHE
jgi:sensor histidine kinase YesM